MTENFQQFIDHALARSPSVGCTQEYEVHHIPIMEDFDRADMLRRLEKRSASERNKPDSLHIGVAGFHNFSVVGITQPSHILLLDVNPAQEEFWKTVVRLLKENAQPEGFSSALNALRIDGSIHCDGRAVPDFEHHQLDSYLAKASWMNDPLQYAYLHRMANEGRIAATSIDLLHDFDRAEVLGNSLKEKGLITDTCYWANIGAFFRPHRGGGYMSRNDIVFGERPRYGSGPGVLTYPIYSYCDRRNGISKSNQLWTDQEMRDAEIYHPETLPPAEQFKRIISAVGGEHGEHYLLESSNRPYREMLIFDGPPKRLPAQERSWRERMKQADAPDAPAIFK